ncbi:uncharacterized protein [Panulirus ornatus]|uniref:uncharacterized protein n=1 Tax=Panulirus ornatus TaxID=150431 RepID=UPI003A83DB56
MLRSYLIRGVYLWIVTWLLAIASPTSSMEDGATECLVFIPTQVGERHAFAHMYERDMDRLLDSSIVDKVPSTSFSQALEVVCPGRSEFLVRTEAVEIEVGQVLRGASISATSSDMCSMSVPSRPGLTPATIYLPEKELYLLTSSGSNFGVPFGEHEHAFGVQCPKTSFSMVWVGNSSVKTPAPNPPVQKTPKTSPKCECHSEERQRLLLQELHEVKAENAKLKRVLLERGEWDLEELMELLYPMLEPIIESKIKEVLSKKPDFNVTAPTETTERVTALTIPTENSVLATVIEEVDEIPANDREIDSAIYKVSSRRWPEKTIRINMEDLDSAQKASFYEIMDYMNGLTCVKYTNTTGRYPELRVQKHPASCASHIGFRGRPMQLMHMNANCFTRQGILIHELFHASGFNHQQTRPDRDNYLFVNLTNVREGNMQNFKKTEGHYGFLMTMGVPYDYSSILQYPSWGFAKDSSVSTITIKDKTFPFKLGQRYTPTRSDIARLNRLYECWDHYLGDDIPGAVPYDQWHKSYMTEFRQSYIGFVGGYDTTKTVSPATPAEVKNSTAPVQLNSTGAVSNSTGAVSNSTGAVSNSTGAVSNSTGTMSNSTGAVSNSTGAVSNSTGAVSNSTGAVSNSTGAVSNSTGAVSNSTGAVSNSTGAVSNSTGAVSNSTGAVSNSTVAVSNSTVAVSNSTAPVELNSTTVAVDGSGVGTDSRRGNLVQRLTELDSLLDARDEIAVQRKKDWQRMSRRLDQVVTSINDYVKRTRHLTKKMRRSRVLSKRRRAQWRRKVSRRRRRQRVRRRH